MALVWTINTTIYPPKVMRAKQPPCTSQLNFSVSHRGFIADWTSANVICMSRSTLPRIVVAGMALVLITVLPNTLFLYQHWYSRLTMLDILFYLDVIFSYVKPYCRPKIGPIWGRHEKNENPNALPFMNFRQGHFCLQLNKKEKIQHSTRLTNESTIMATDKNTDDFKMVYTAKFLEKTENV